VLTVNKATPTITWATPSAITYGTLLSGTQLNASSGGIPGTLTYTPASGALLAAGNQTLSVQFVPDDGTNYKTTSTTVTLTVNAAPTITDIVDTTTAEDTATSALAFTIGDGETAAALLTVTATSSDTTLIPNANLVLGGSGAGRTLTATPAANLFGAATITVTVSDSMATTSDTFVLTVTAVNDAPTLAAIANPTAILEDAGAQTVNLTGVAAGGGETQVLTVTASSSNTALIPNPTVTYTSAATTGSLSYTPVANANGTAVITVTVTDNGGTANSGVATTTTSLHRPTAPACPAHTPASAEASRSLRHGPAASRPQTRRAAPADRRTGRNIS
jgi:hypothetical protein